VTRRARWPIAALAVLACAVPGSAIGQEERKQDNFALAVVQTDNTSAFDFSWEVTRQRRGPVDSFNAARAVAVCTDCRATAIAFQVVLAWGDGSGEVAPHNQSVAINDQCTRCVVYAGARQFVRVMSGPARFTATGRSTLADVRNKLRAIEGADLTVDEQIAIVEAQEARVIDVLVHEVVPIEGEGRAMVEDRDDREADDG
jgi:putative peptide zinc metalloprotease protein